MPRFYFDFISPYSYIASQRIARDFSHWDLDYRPVVFGTMLSKRNAIGPGEIPSRRRIGLQDILLLAAHHSIPLRGPPSHPFNSIYALRSVCAVPDPVQKAKLCDRYFRAAWAENRDLADLNVLRECLAEVGIDHDPEEIATTRRHRASLKENTKQALAAGAWGVPSFEIDGLMFFGQDRLMLLDAYLKGDLRLDERQLADILARPQPGRIQ